MRGRITTTKPKKSSPKSSKKNKQQEKKHHQDLTQIAWKMKVHEYYIATDWIRKYSSEDSLLQKKNTNSMYTFCHRGSARPYWWDDMKKDKWKKNTQWERTCSRFNTHIGSRKSTESWRHKKHETWINTLKRCWLKINHNLKITQI